METVNNKMKLICGVCYVFGIYLIASKLGIIDHLLKTEGSSSPPSMGVCLSVFIAYTTFFAIIVYYVYKINKQKEDHVKTQQQVGTLHNASEQLALLQARYVRVCRQKTIDCNASAQRFKLLQRQMAGLPISVLEMAGTQAQLSRIVEQVEKGINDIERGSDAAAAKTAFTNNIESLLEQLKTIRTNSIDSVGQ